MKVKFWNVGTGDAITIQFKDQDNKTRNVFIDGGYLRTYRLSIKTEITNITQAGQLIDLWILTHTDRDHIGGAEAFIKDESILNKSSIVDSFWFNWSDYSFTPVVSKISVAQGIKLRDYLANIGKLSNNDIHSLIEPIKLHGCCITVLSPNTEVLEKSKLSWQEEESRKPVAAFKNDYNQTIETLSTEAEITDTDPFNGGSIAILIEREGRSIMLLGDCHPSVVVGSLKKLGYSESRRLKVDYIKLSHHGSRRNISREFISLVDCQNFVILADGNSNALPNKWSLANIVTSPMRDISRKICFYFNNSNPILSSIFEVDANKEKYNFECIYSSGPYLEINL